MVGAVALRRPYCYCGTFRHGFYQGVRFYLVDDDRIVQLIS